MPPERNQAIAPQPFSAGEALRRLGAVALVGGGLAGLHAITGLGIACPFLAATGYLCPFCGATRSAVAIASADLRAAWAHNQAFVVAAIITIVAAVAWIVEVAGGPALRPPAAVRPLTQGKVYLAVGVALVAFWVLRNIW